MELVSAQNIHLQASWKYFLKSDLLLNRPVSSCVMTGRLFVPWARKTFCLCCVILVVQTIRILLNTIKQFNIITVEGAFPSVKSACLITEVGFKILSNSSIKTLFRSVLIGDFKECFNRLID